MYTIYADDICIYDDTKSSDISLQLVSPKLVLADNTAGTFTVTIPPTNVGYESIIRLRTTITILRDGEWLWEGRVLSEDRDFWNQRKVTCEGVLAYLNDTHQEIGKYEHVTIDSFLMSVLNIHNQHVPMNRRIFLGNVTVFDTEDPLTSYETTYDDDTLSCINTKVVQVFGGHIMIRHEDGFNYLDYLSLDDEHPGHESSQTIDFGKNLLDFTRKFEAENFATVLLPLGAQADDGRYVTVAKVNDDSIYVESEAAEYFGWIEKVVHFDMVAMPWRLMQKAEEYLSKLQFDSVVIELKAVDLSVLNPNVEPFNLLDTVHVISHPHGMDTTFPVTKIDIPLDSPENVVYTLGGTIQESLTTIQKNATKKVETKIEGISDTVVSKVIDTNIAKEFSNTESITINEGESKAVAVFKITPKENTSIVFHAEIAHYTETVEETVYVDEDSVNYIENDCSVTAQYDIDGAIQMAHPVFSEFDGDHVIHLLYHFSVSAGADVQFTASLSCLRGVIDIPVQGIHAYIIGTAQMEPGEYGETDSSISTTDYISIADSFVFVDLSEEVSTS